MLNINSDKPLLIWLLPAAGILLIVLLVVVGYGIFGGERLPPPDELASQALDQTASEQQRVQAALTLTRHGSAAQTEMRRLLKESQNSDVRAAAVDGLAKNGDWEDMPFMIDALNDPSPWVRNRASRAVWRQLGTNFDFNPKDPPQRRAEAIEKIKKQYKWLGDYQAHHHGD